MITDCLGGLRGSIDRPERPLDIFKQMIGFGGRFQSGVCALKETKPHLLLERPDRHSHRGVRYAEHGCG